MEKKNTFGTSRSWLSSVVWTSNMQKQKKKSKAIPVTGRGGP
jgi:hypothetical protein